MPTKHTKSYFVYLLLCKDTSIYTGITTDVARRLAEHQQGIGSHYTSAKRAERILYTEPHPSRSEALKREAAIKKLSREDKLKLAGYTLAMKKLTRKSEGKTVEGYVNSFPPKVSSRLKTLRSIIKKAAPKAEEKVSYGLAGYKLNGKPLMYFGGFKNHVGLIVLPSTTTKFKKELTGYKTVKSGVQFQHGEPLPLPLIRKLVAARVKEALPKRK